MEQNSKEHWHLVDATDQVLGRMSTRIALLLMGKHKKEFVRYKDVGDHVIVINTAKVRVTGRKQSQKQYYRHSGYPGGLKVISFGKLLAQKPQEIIRHAVRGMLPHNRIGAKLLNKLHVYEGPDHPHTNLAREEPV